MNKLGIIFLLLLTTYLNAGQELQKVSLQLQWKHQFEFAGYYMAQEKGFYKDVGLDVDIREFDYHINIVEDVVNSKVTYGINYSNLIQEKSNGKDIVLLSAMMQSSPHAIISLKSSGIKSINDFKNKKIMITSVAQKTEIFTAMLESNKISPDDLIKVKHTFNIEDLISGKTDLMSCFIGNEPYILDEKGIAYDIWNPKDYGFDFYDIILFTSAKELQNNPSRVENFRVASLKGWEYAFNHIEETAELILKKYNTQEKSKGALIYEANILKKLAYQGSDTLGHIDKIKIQNIYGVYNLANLANEQIDLESFIYFKAMEDVSNKHKLNFEIIKNILIAIVIIFFLVVYRHIILRKANKNLEENIKKEIQANRVKDNMLNQQTKMAEMGEMIGNIAHQWKQPLAILNVINATLKEQNNYDKLSKEELNNSLDDMEVNIMQMSQTVEDFLSYFNPNKHKEDFSLLQAVDKALFMIEHTIKKECIDIFIEIDDSLSVHGFKEEFMQVIITIVMNSIHVLENKDLKKIYLHAHTSDGKTMLEISDNGGGVKEEIMQRIFEPYFTTRHQEHGTGLGLYIAKMIIENSMDGDLRVQNIADGAKFTISI